MGAGSDGLGDLTQMDLHGSGIAKGQDPGSSRAPLGADGAKEMGPCGALIMGRARAAFRAAPNACSACSSDRPAFHPGTKPRSACLGGGLGGSPPHARGSFFKSGKRRLILTIGLGAHRHGAEPHLPQDAAHRLLRERDAELLPEPLHQVLQTPAHHAMNRPGRALFPHRRQPRLLLRVQLRQLTRSLAIDQTLRARAIEAMHPVPQSLAVHAADQGAFKRIDRGLKKLRYTERMVRVQTCINFTLCAAPNAP